MIVNWKSLFRISPTYRKIFKTWKYEISGWVSLRDSRKDIKEIPDRFLSEKADNTKWFGPNPISFFIYSELMIRKTLVFSLTLDALNILTGIWIYIQLIENASRCSTWEIFFKISSFTSSIILRVLRLSLSDNLICNYWRDEMWSLAKHIIYR